MSFYVKLWEKEVLEKMILVLEKSLIFSPKILCEPCDISGLTCLNKQPGGGGGGAAIYGLYRYVLL